MSAIDYKILLTKNDCYKANRKMTPKGIVVHSTGANNPTLRRYVAPDNGYIGKNAYNNDWNRSGLDACVHAFIGQDKNGAVKTVQTLPFDVCCWGVGIGSKGSYNYNPPYIQFEMCEDGLTNKTYCTAVYNKAVELCVYLCKTYNISVNNIVSHYEAYQKGYGSGHVDPTNWWNKHGFTMDKFRAAVKAKLNGATTTASTSSASKPSTSTATSTAGIKAGQTVKLNKAPLYVSATAKTKASDVSGTYYLWSAEAVSGRYRITTQSSFVGKTGKVTGWIDAKYITSSSAITVGDKVKVTKAVTYDGKAFKTYYDKYDVLSVSGDRVVIGIGKTTTAAVKASNLSKV